MKFKISTIIALSIASLIFFLIFIPEIRRFDALSPIKNPFETEISIQKIKIEKGEKEQEIFTPQGELFIVFPESEFQFSPNRELKEGTIFWSTMLIQKTENWKNKQETELWKNKPAQSGELKIGDILVRQEQGNVVIEKKTLQKKIIIITQNAPLEIFFGKQNHPFIVPANKKITIVEPLLNEKTFALFYSKLKKEFQMEKAEKRSEMEKGILGIKKKEKEITDFVENFYNNWRNFQSRGIFAELKNFQYQNAIGLPKKRKPSLKQAKK